MKSTLTRRLFVVLLAENNHGKSRIMTRILSQGVRRSFDKGQMGERTLTSPWGREIDAYLFVRSYQETLKSDFKSAKSAIDTKDPSWRKRELIIWPSHLQPIQDLDEMIELAHSAGFDAVVVSVVLGDSELSDHEQAWLKPWDERWTLSNLRRETDWEGQVDALAHDLWTRIGAAVTGQ